MSLPFSTEQFFAVFTRYNEAVWPAQLVLAALAIGVLVAIARGAPGAARLGYGLLALLWAWMAIVYHALFFSSINPAAWLFAALSGVAALLFAREATTRPPAPAGTGRPRRLVGWLLVLYALPGYPLVAWAAGQRYPGMPTFGLPCPTTIWTLGVLVLLPGSRRRLAVVPLLWAVVGTSAAVQLGVPEDFGLPAAALLALPFLVRVRGKVPPTSQLA